MLDLACLCLFPKSEYVDVVKTELTRGEQNEFCYRKDGLASHVARVIATGQLGEITPLRIGL